ncbi:phosphotransferase enzyme family protein [Salinarimonas ramus]|uniref:Aminoglycoside phosphotransferase n=1 Tax=Salinarimonas ramus TaxID=690164 RepID=A0A917V692_9HYPH|nr:phosphotransferase [Salinarimonas ramus]GGK42829.1 aminoglycoside phosphotransferase [Salinarimonas ramus]
MRAYDELTRSGQIRRMGRVAGEALRRYGLKEPRLTVLRHVENTTFHVRVPGECSGDHDGGRYLLRVHGYQQARAVDSECAWLLHLSGRAELPCPVPVTTSDGCLSVSVEVSGAAAARTCSLLRWVPGRHRRHWAPKPIHFRRLGRLMGRLHAAASAWDRPGTFVRPTWNWDGLFGGEGAFGQIGVAGWSRLPLEHVDRFRAAAERIAATMAALGTGSDAFGLIHADLHFDNVVFRHGEPIAIDFDDCGAGYWAYDIATALRPWRLDPQFDAVRSAFEEGYRSERALPAGLEALDHFIVARHLATTLWAASRAGSNAELARSLPARCAATSAAIGMM